MAFFNGYGSGANVLSIIQDEQTSLVSNKLSIVNNDGVPKQEFILANLNEWKGSDRYKLMLTGDRYYNNENDILERKRYEIGEKGSKVESKHLANNKLAHSFMRKLVKQKIGYLLSKPFSIDTENEKYMKELDLYFDKAFFRMLKNIGKDAIKAGISWLQVYYDELGKLSFKRIPSNEVVAFWADAEHTQLDAVIRFYEVDVYTGTKKSTVTKLEFYDENGVWFYQINTSGHLEVDSDKPAVRAGNFTVPDPESKEDGAVLQMTWERIPFIAFKYNSEEVSLIKFVKPLIDDYDRVTSDMSNDLEDTPNSVKVVKNYDGTDLGDFIQNLSMYRAVKVTDPGGLEMLTPEFNTEANEKHLDRLRKDLYECGQGVDTQNKDIGTAASGVALKFLYADLDMDCADMGAEFSAALEQLTWFICMDMANKGLGDYSEEDVEFVFNTDITINETETIDNLSKSTELSLETKLANHPYVTDAAEELKRVKAERQEQIDEMAKLGYGTKTDPNKLPQKPTPPKV